MAKKKSPINIPLAEIREIGNQAFAEAALEAKEAGYVFTYSDRTTEVSEYTPRALAHKSKSARNKTAVTDAGTDQAED